MPPRLEGATRRPAKKRREPKPISTAFSPLGRADAPLLHAVRRASRKAAVRERAAADRLPSRPQVPIIPKLPSYTPKQQAYIRHRVGPTVLRAVVHEGHAQSYASDAAHHERKGGSHRDASTPFARLLRNSNARERDTLHIFERLGGGEAVDRAVEGARRRTVRAQLGAVLAGKAPANLAADLERRGYLERHHVFGLKSGPKIGGYYTTAKAGHVGAPVGQTHMAIQQGAGVGESFLRTPEAVASVSHALGDRGGGVGHVIGNAGADLALGPTMAAGTLVHLAAHPKKGAGEIRDAIAETFKHPVKSFEEHPVWTLQTFEGARAAGGRAVGAGVRAATRGRRGGTTRSPLSMVGDQGTHLTYSRRYSKDIMRQAVQRAADKRLKPVLAPDGKVATVMQHGREVPVLRASTNRPVTRPSRLLKKRGDFDSSKATALQQQAVAYEAEQARRMLPTREHRGGRVGRAVGSHIDRALPAQPVNALQARFLSKRALRPEHDLVSMAVEGTIRPGHMHADLLKERARVEAEYKTLKSPRLRSANRFRARTIDRALADPKAMANEAGVFKSAHAFAERINELQAQGVELHQIPGEAAARAKLFPYAMSHMGARHGTDPALDAHIAQATSDLRSLQAKRNFHAKTDEQRAALDKRMTAIRASRDESREANVEALRGPSGRVLDNEDIHAHMRDPQTGPVVDPAHVAYVPHRLDLKSATAYYQQALRRRPSSSDAKRTGAAYKAGATSPTVHTLAESVIRQAGALTNLKSFDRLVHDAGIRQEDGSYFTMAEAEHEVQRRSVDSHNRDVPGEPELVPVRVFKAKLSAEEQARVREMQDPRSGAGVENVLEPWQRRLDKGDRTSRNVVLMPKPLVDRIDEHLQRSSPGARVGQGVTSMFRQTVLPFSSKWIVGNVAEAVLRLGAVGATALPGDRNMAAGRRVIRELLAGDARGLEGAIGKRAAREIIDHLLGGQIFGNRSLRVRRTGSEMFGDVGQAVSQTPVVHELAGSYRALTGGIFRLNKMLEQRSQVAALGKFARRDIQEFTGSWAKGVRLQREAVQEAARGLVDTAKQHEAARFIDETLGQYSRFSPTMRHFIQNAAPFLPWYLNSVRFVFWTLPAHHPVKTALLVNAEKAFQQDWQDQHKAIPPKIRGALRMASPTKDGGWRDFARFTPFGGPGPVLAGDNRALVSPIYPQFQGAVNALSGLDPFGRPMQVPKTATNPSGTPTPGQERAAAANQFVEGIAGPVGLVRRLREHGETAYGSSTALRPQTKPGTSHKMSAARRVFDPLRPTYLRKASTSSSLTGLPPAERRAILREAGHAARQTGSGVSRREAEAVKREAELILRQAGG